MNAVISKRCINQKKSPVGDFFDENNDILKLMQIETATNEIDKFILKLDAQTQARVLRHLDLLEKYGYKLGMPYSKSLHGGLFELRITGSKQVRILYCFHKGAIYLLHAFIKKVNKIPKRDINLAIKRLKMLA